MNKYSLWSVIRFVLQALGFVLAWRPMLWLYGMFVRRLVVKLEVETEWIYALLNSGFLAFLVVLLVVSVLWLICRIVLKMTPLVGRVVFCVLLGIILLLSQAFDASWHPLFGSGSSDIRTKLIVPKFIVRRWVFWSEEKLVNQDNLTIALEREHGASRPFEKFNLTDMRAYAVEEADEGWVGVVRLNNAAWDRLSVCLKTNEYSGYRVVCGQSDQFFETEKATHGDRIMVCKAREQGSVIDFLVEATTHSIPLKESEKDVTTLDVGEGLMVE